MVDRLSPERRSWLMSRIRSRNTSPEIRVRRAAHALGLRFRLYRRDLPGTPDLIFPKHRVALFVHGCFWHQHPGCPKASMPKTAVDAWQSKFARNIKRDAENTAILTELGWRVEVIWECETKKPAQIFNRLNEIFFPPRFDIRIEHQQSNNPAPFQ